MWRTCRPNPSLHRRRRRRRALLAGPAVVRRLPSPPRRRHEGRTQGGASGSELLVDTAVPTRLVRGYFPGHAQAQHEITLIRGDLGKTHRRVRSGNQPRSPCRPPLRGRRGCLRSSPEGRHRSVPSSNPAFCRGLSASTPPPSSRVVAPRRRTSRDSRTRCRIGLDMLGPQIVARQKWTQLTGSPHRLTKIMSAWLRISQGKQSSPDRDQTARSLRPLWISPSGFAILAYTCGDYHEPIVVQQVAPVCTLTSWCNPQGRSPETAGAGRQAGSLLLGRPQRCRTDSQNAPDGIRAD